MRKEFADYKLTYSIGGQISFDVFPQVIDAQRSGAQHSSAQHSTARSPADC